MFNSQNFEINLQNYPSGIYIIKMTDDTGVVLQEKIIKQ
ncbi:MAG: T9SS type A sorting domain-containing protein [Bacteroidales bacterium]|nr:T9SS type A sorting domain-containing protein [Bacteroidales bacterium]